MAEKFDLYLGGGVMSGVFGAGVVTGLQEANAYDKIRKVRASSAGSFNGAYFLSGQSHLGSTIYWENLPGNFIRPGRIPGLIVQSLKRRIMPSPDPALSVVDIDFLFRVADESKPLDVPAIKRRGIPFELKVYDTQNKEVLYTDALCDTIDRMRSCVSAVPYHHSGGRYVDGEITGEPLGLSRLLEDSASKLVVVLNYSSNQGVPHDLKNTAEGLLAHLMYPNSGMLERFRNKRSRFQDDVRRALLDKRVLVVSPPRESRTTLYTTDPATLIDTWEMGRKESRKVLDFVC
jgi:predicted patatin/cPLA2 family phospholipase